jgi:hypothetical protein
VAGVRKAENSVNNREVKYHGEKCEIMGASLIINPWLA